MKIKKVYKETSSRAGQEEIIDSSKIDDIETRVWLYEKGFYGNEMKRVRNVNAALNRGIIVEQFFFTLEGIAV